MKKVTSFSLSFSVRRKKRKVICIAYHRVMFAMDSNDHWAAGVDALRLSLDWDLWQYFESLYSLCPSSLPVP